MKRLFVDVSPVAQRMRRYRARKIFEHAISRALICGIPQEELEELVGFVASGVQMRFHRRGRPRVNVTSRRYFKGSQTVSREP